MIYVNSNYGELAVVKVDKENLTLNKKGLWKSSDNHGNGGKAPASGGVFVTEIKNGDEKKMYALITAADDNEDGYLYWLDVTDPTNITKVDSLHDTDENYGFNDIWLNDTKIYLAAHNGFCFMGMDSTRNIPVISIKDSDGNFKEDINVTKHAEKINDTKTFYVKINNHDNSNKLDARVTAPKAQNGWEYAFYDGDHNITEKITGKNGYIIENIPASDSHTLKITMTPISNNATDATITFNATNKETKAVCGKPIESDKVVLRTTFLGSNIFSCSENSYIFTSSSKKDPLDSYNINIITGESHLEKSHFHDVNINAIGYNILDNYIWGYDRIEHKIARVDANYHVDLHDVSELPDKDFVAGDVSPKGILYLYDKDDKDAIIYGIDVNSSSSNYLKVVNSFKLEDRIKTSDMAFNPIDGRLYFINNDNGDLYRLNVSNHKLENLNNTEMQVKKKNSGGNYFDRDGNFYIYNNTGAIYKVDISDPDNVNPKATFLHDAPEFESKDGARCPNAPAPKEPEKNECTLAFPGALSSTNDEIQINDKTKIYGTTNHTLITETLSTKKSVRCDDEPCKKSDTLAKTLSFDLDLGNGKDGDKILTDNKNLTISSDKAYKKFQTGQNNKITIDGNITIKSQSDFYINQKSEITINDNVVIYADKFDANQANQFKINGSLKIIANIFYLNSDNKLYDIPSADKFIVLAKDKIDINSHVDFKGIFYSGGDIQVNDHTRIIGAMTGNYIDVNDHSYIEYDADAVDTYCLPKIVKPSHFNVWDRDESINHQVIKTKIVGKDIDLTFATLDDTGTAFEETKAKDIQVALFSNTAGQLTIWNSLILDKVTKMNITFSSDDFAFYGHKNEAFKAVKVFIKYKDSNGTEKIQKSSDSFALRPNNYKISTIKTTPKYKAGEDFNITVKAVDYSGNVVTNYNENSNVYKIDYNETNSSYITGVLSGSQANFNNGVAKFQAKYSEVGKIDFNISEVISNEFASIDQGDGTTQNQRSIGNYSYNMERIYPSKIEITSWDFKSNGNYTYYSTQAKDMGASLDINLSVKNKDDATLKNFEGIYAEDISIELNHNVISGTLPTVTPIFVDITTNTNLTHVMDTANKIKYKIEHNIFNNGIGGKNLKVNFTRDTSKVMEPLKWNISNPHASTLSNAIGDAIGNKEVIYLYVRAHAPNQQAQGKNLDAKIYYEVYCKDCTKSNFSIENLNESIDDIYWYILNPPYNTTSCNFSGEHGLISNQIVKTPHSNDKIILKASKTPYTDKVIYDPNPWLVYNRFNPSATSHSFRVEFNSAGDSKWAGQGKVGLTVDRKISKASYQKMDW